MRPYVLTVDDQQSIRTAIQEGGNIWSSGHLDEFKRNLKDFYRNEQNQQCCYCKRVTVGEFRMVLDIEHILPKGTPAYRRHMFEPKNLSIACKRCNMEIKKQDTSFISITANFDPDFFDSNNYLFIHPHTDNYWDHIDYSMVVENDYMLIQYTVKSPNGKGQYTYDYFKLNDLEVDAINNAQGIESQPISEEIDEDIALEIQQSLMAL